MGDGRPTKYRGEYCDQIVTFMSEGKSVVQFACDIGVHRDSIYAWAETNEAFSDALKRAKDASESYWENHLQFGALGIAPQINVAATAIILKCRFGWRDKDPIIASLTDKEDRAGAADKLRLSVMRK